MDFEPLRNRVLEGQQVLAALRPLPADVIAELAHRYEVRLTHHSTAIEGNTLTQSETQIVLEKGLTIAGKSVREHLEVIGHKEALLFVHDLASHHEPLTEHDLRQLHALVMKGEEGGTYRTLDVIAAGTEYRYVNHLQVPALMADWISRLADPPGVDPVTAAAVAHHEFVSIHPFRDGNGRMARLILNLLLLREGFPLAVIPVQRRSEYIDAVFTWQSREEPAGFLKLVFSCVEESLRDTLETVVSSSQVTHKREAEAWLSR